MKRISDELEEKENLKDRISVRDEETEISLDSNELPKSELEKTTTTNSPAIAQTFPTRMPLVPEKLIMTTEAEVPRTPQTPETTLRELKEEAPDKREPLQVENHIRFESVTTERYPLMNNATTLDNHIFKTAGRALM